MSDTRIVEGMPFAEYAAAPGINSGLLNVARKSSLKRVRAYMDGVREEATDSMIFGSIFHAYMLEGKEEFVIRPDTYPAPKTHAKVKSGEIKEGEPLPWNGIASVCKEWEAGQSQPIITQSHADSLLGMRKAILAEPSIAEYFSYDPSNRQTELSIFTNGFKGRIDLLPKCGPVIDIKTTKCARPDVFVKQVWERGYHIQMALYLDILQACEDPREEFWLVAVETEYPFDLYVAQFKDGDLTVIDHGRKMYRKALRRIQDAKKAESWPSYGAGDTDQHLTTWMQAEIAGS